MRDFSGDLEEEMVLDLTLRTLRVLRHVGGVREALCRRHSHYYLVLRKAKKNEKDKDNSV